MSSARAGDEGGDLGELLASVGGLSPAKALDFEASDCEYLECGSTRAGVTIVMFHVMLGC
jgi:hypothetical protein